MSRCRGIKSHRADFLSPTATALIPVERDGDVTWFLLFFRLPNMAPSFSQRDDPFFFLSPEIVLYWHPITRTS